MVGVGVHSKRRGRAAVRLEPWAKGDLVLLQRILGDPAMMGHLGGPEGPAKIAERQTRYERPDSKQFKIIDAATAEGAGWVGYWRREWQDSEVYEIGWSVLPVFQGRGIARSAAIDAIAIARSEGACRFMHAYPSVENVASNAVCRSLGFRLLGSGEFEYPKGSIMQCNDWRLDLRSAG